MRGTHTATWLGIGPTGKEVSVQLMVTQRIENGDIVEDRVLVKALGLFQQHGLIPGTQEILIKAGS
jgi:hypothetical protein